MDEILEAMRAATDRHCTTRRVATEIPRLALYRADGPVPPAHMMYNPRICVILRGSKTVSLGSTRFEADVATLLLVTVDLPVTTEVRLDDDGRPHLGLLLELDRAVLAEVLQQLLVAGAAGTARPGLCAAPMSAELLEALARLLKLLDHGSDRDFLAPLIIREIYFRLLHSELREALVQFAMSGSHLDQISRATDWIKAHYSEPTSVARLAEIAGMSVTSFHRHFKHITLMSPLRYRTQIRLHEARSALIATRKNAGAVALAVGYESQSQFGRDYKRLFGTSPAADAARLLGTA